MRPSLRDAKGVIIYCGHPDCRHPAVQVVTMTESLQTHDCCLRHVEKAGYWEGTDEVEGHVVKERWVEA